MKYISHRGNLNTINSDLENSEEYILNALNQNYYVEIDLWKHDNKLFLGHDEPLYETTNQFLDNPYFYVHCKNADALLHMNSFKWDCDYFWHENDKYTITSKSIIWVHQSALVLPNSICVLPEENRSLEELKLCYGICSDFIEKFRI